MDTGIEIVQPIWLDSYLLTDFIDELRESGYRIGVSQYIAVQDLMVALANQGKLPDNPERLRTLLAPILCSSPTEQEDFQYQFDDWLKLIRCKERKNNEASLKEKELLLEEAMMKSRSRFRPLMLSLIAIVLSSLLFRTSNPIPSPSPTVQQTPSSSPTVQQTPSPPPTVQTAYFPLITNLHIRQKWQITISLSVLYPCLVFCLIFLGWRWWWFWRAQLFLERRSTKQPPELHNISIDVFKHNLLPLVPFIQISQNLRQRISISSNDLDINRTIETSLCRGGWLTPIYNFRQIHPEYLFLIDRSSFRDHQARFADEIINNLRQNGVFITSYYFDNNPLICFHSDGITSYPHKIKEIALNHPQYRLVIIADADRFYDSATGELEKWVTHIKTWKNRAILTPNPVETWGHRELELMQQFIVLPIDSNGFQILGQLFSQGKTNSFLSESNQLHLPEILRVRPHRWIENTPPAVEQIDEMLTSLHQYLGEDGFYWLSACAVYPDLQWNITIYLGNAIKTENGYSLSETSSIINLSRLPWFRYGYMPNWLRDLLIQILPLNQGRIIRYALQNLLLTSIDGKREDFQLKVAKQNYFFLTRLASSILHILSRIASPNSPIQDYTFLSFMLRKPKLSTKVPYKLDYLLRKNKKIHWSIRIGIIITVCFFLFIGIFYYQQIADQKLFDSANKIYPAEIADLQELLSGLGFYDGAIDGIKGDSTIDAIKKAQAFYGLEVTGIVDSQLIASLKVRDLPTMSTTTPIISSGVANLQELLAQRGFYNGPISGILSPDTKSAIIAAQKAYGLEPNGIADSRTIAALESSSSRNKDVTQRPSANDIFGLQKLLSKRGFYSGKIDGIMNTETRNAIIRAQIFYTIEPLDGLPSDKLIDGLTE